MIVLFLIIFSPIFCPGDFSEILEIFRVDVKVNEVDRFLLSSKKSLPVGKYGCFSFFKKRSCPCMFSKTVIDRDLKFSEGIDLE